MKEKFDARRSHEKTLEKSLKIKDKNSLYTIITTNNIPAVLYIKNDNNDYYKVNLQPQKVFKQE